MEKPVKLQFRDPDVLLEVRLAADSRAVAGDVLRALGTARGEVMGAVSGGEDGFGVGGEAAGSAGAARWATDLSGLVLGVRPPDEFGGEPYALSPHSSLLKAPIPPGSTLFVAVEGSLPLAGRAQSSATTLQPDEQLDARPGPVPVSLPPSPRLWVANPATLAIPALPVLCFGAAALLAPGIATVGLFLAAVGAAVGEVLYARRDNESQWQSFAQQLQEKPAQIRSAQAQRDEVALALQPPFEVFTGIATGNSASLAGDSATTALEAAPGPAPTSTPADLDPGRAATALHQSEPAIWGYPLENPALPVGWTRVTSRPQLRWNWPIPPYRGPGLLGQEWHGVLPVSAKPAAAQGEDPSTAHAANLDTGATTGTNPPSPLAANFDPHNPHNSANPDPAPIGPFAAWAAQRRENLLRRAQELAEPVANTPIQTLGPVFVHAAGGPLAVVGAAKWRAVALNHLVGRLALRYRPDRLGILVLAEAQRTSQWDWAQYLPHVATAQRWLGQPAVRLLSGDHQQVAGLALQLRRLLEKHPRRRLVVVVDGVLPAGSPLEELGDLPLWLINAVPEPSLAVEASRQILDLRTGPVTGGVWDEDWASHFGNGTLALSGSRSGSTVMGVTGAGATSSAASQFKIEPFLASKPSARSLAVWLSGYQLSPAKPSELPLFASLDDAWNPGDFPASATQNATATPSSTPTATPSSTRRPSLEAPIGFGMRHPVSLDLSTGNNALVLGETTVARGNLVAAYLVGLCLRESPQHVNFLIFDSRSVPWGELLEAPHCLGLETGRGQEVYDRLMRYLEAESVQREDWLEEHQLHDFATARARGLSAPAELVLVLATAEAFTPRQLTDLVGRIQLYRSRGIHVIVSMGDPARLPAEILPYLPTRVLLQLDPEQVVLVCGSLELPGESVFTAPGRGILISGGLAESFQTLNTILSEGADWSPPVSFSPLSVVSGVEDAAVAQPSPETRCAALEKAAQRLNPTSRQTPVAELAPRFQRGTTRGKRWLGKLGTRYNLAKLGQSSAQQLILGVLDDAAHQAVTTFGFAPARDGSLLVTGPAGSGKTTALRVLAASSLNSGAPGGIYVLGDVASWKPLLSWGNVGVVAAAEEPEVVADTIEAVAREVQSRRAAAGLDEAGGPGADVEADQGGEDRDASGLKPTASHRILLIIDALEEILEVLPATASSQLLQIITGGREVGVHLAVSAQSLEAVPAPWRSAFKLRLEMQRRGAGTLDNDSRPVQVAILGADPEAEAQAAVLERLGTVAQSGTGLAPKVRRQPVPLYESALHPAAQGHFALGLEVATGQQIDVLSRGLYLVTGADAPHRRLALRYLATAARRASQDSGLVFLSLAGAATPQSATHTPPQNAPEPTAGIPLTTPGDLDREQGVAHLAAAKVWDATALGVTELEQYRHQLLAVSQRPSPAGFPGLAIFVEDFPGFAAHSELNQTMLELVEAARERGHLLIAEGSPEAWLADSALTAVAKVPAAGLGLGMDPETLRRIFGAGASHGVAQGISQDGRIFPALRGYWIAQGQARKVQIPQALN